MLFPPSSFVRICLLFACCFSFSELSHAATKQLARSQPTVPEGWVETPFIESSPAPTLTATERHRGYLLFQRPITEPIYANTQPRSFERLEKLSAFGTPGEFEPVTFSMYPIRDMKNVSVSCSPLEGKNGSIAASQIDIRLLTYWNVAYPRYSSEGTYRKVPELLEKVTSHSSPAKECLRWWLTLHVPEDAKPGVYSGTVTIHEAGNARSVKIPLMFRVLGFSLQDDPRKQFSVYYYVRNRTMFKGRDEKFIDRATANEYRTMVKYGINMLPTFYLQYDTKKKEFYIQNEQEIPRAIAAGMKGPLPLLGGRGILRLYLKMTPGGKKGDHWRINKEPSPLFYRRLTDMFRLLKQDCAKRGLPEFVCCPLDEISASHSSFGSRVYKAVHAAGVKTYATKFPTAADARFYEPYVDIWCSQPFAKNYQQVVSDKRHEYWSYPNHNAGERKNRTVMCKGGRMTYGFGLWKSGYTTLIPWHWAWTMRPDPFDYLRTLRAGCGQRIDDNGDVIPAVYWESFREGRDDGRYLFTLQQATWEREGTASPACQLLVTEAQNMLQETWDAIDAQERYLADNVWHSTEFNARRWRMAVMTEQLLKYSVNRKGVVPPVYVKNILALKKVKPSVVKDTVALKNMTTFDLGEDFKAWRAGTPEASVKTVPASAGNVDKVLQWKVNVDHNRGGKSDGKYNVGWPRIRRFFKKEKLDMSGYDFLEARVRVDSNRDEVADDITKLGISFSSHSRSRLYEIRRDLGDQQQKWLTLRYSISEMIRTADGGVAPWRSINHVQFFIAESDYQHGNQLTFEISSVRLLRFKRPVISRLNAPKFVVIPQKTLPITFEIMGTSTVKLGSHHVTASLIDSSGKLQTKTTLDLSGNKLIALNTSAIRPGKYQLKLAISTNRGKNCDQSQQIIEFLAGP